MATSSEAEGQGPWFLAQVSLAGLPKDSSLSLPTSGAQGILWLVTSQFQSPPPFTPGCLVPKSVSASKAVLLTRTPTGATLMSLS